MGEIKITYFNQIYLGHANRVISSLVERGKADKISRSKIEMQILEEIDKSDFPIAYRIAWISLVLHTDTFDIFWLGQQDLHHLSKDAIARLKPDMSLIGDVASPSLRLSPSISSSEQSSDESDEENMPVSTDGTFSIEAVTPNQINPPTVGSAQASVPEQLSVDASRIRGASPRVAPTQRKTRLKSKKPQPPALAGDSVCRPETSKPTDINIPGQTLAHDVPPPETVFESSDGRLPPIDPAIIGPHESAEKQVDALQASRSTKRPGRGRGGRKKTVRFDLPNDANGDIGNDNPAPPPQKTRKTSGRKATHPSVGGKHPPAG